MNLDEWLWRNKITQQKVADDLGISYVTINKAVSNKTSPDLITCLALHAYTKGEVDLTTFLKESDKKRLDAILHRLHQRENDGNDGKEHPNSSNLPHQEF